MKQVFLFILAGALLSITSCSKRELNPVWNDPAVLSTETKGSEKSNAIDYTVTDEDLHDYLRIRQVWNKGKAMVKSIEVFSGEVGEPMAYLVNYENGWEIVSADKRTRISLAYSNTGNINLETWPDEQRSWVYSVIEEVRLLRKMNSFEIAKLGEEATLEMENNVLLWKAITFASSYNKRHPTKAVPLPQGYYELDLNFCEVDTLEYQSVSHLIPIHWHQSSPYNNYCPYRIDIPTSRAPAGCVAIAGAQMLYYLNYAYGFPIYSPSVAVCTGNIDSYIMEQTVPSSTIWSQMSTDGDKAAILVANVGKRVGMSYGNHSSMAYTHYLPNLVFSQYGVTCNYNTFNATTVCSSLQDGMPAIIRASDIYGAGGHAFIIDGYSQYRIRTTIRYNWVSTDPSPDPQVIIDPILYEYSYTSPFITDFRMNWGWGANYDDGNYGLSGSWAISSFDFSADRYMITGFAAQ